VLQIIYFAAMSYCNNIAYYLKTHIFIWIFLKLTRDSHINKLFTNVANNMIFKYLGKSYLTCKVLIKFFYLFHKNIYKNQVSKSIKAPSRE